MLTVDAGVGPAGYHERHYTPRDWRFYSGILAEIVQHSSPGTILDLGAGCGFLAEGASRWGFHSVALEGAAAAIEMARRRCPELDIRQHLLSAPLPLQDSCFQTVVMNQVIEHLEPELAIRCLAESRRVLKPGGMILIKSPSRANTKEREADPTHLHLYAPRELRELLQAQGFVNVQSQDAALPIFGASGLGRGLASALFRLTGWDRLSATANCIAYKPASQAAP